MSAHLVVVLGAFLALGLAITGLGLASLGQWYRLARRSSDAIHQVTEGPTEFEGTVRPPESGETVRSGLTGEECLLYEYEVEEYEEGRHGGSWSTVASGSDAVTFVVGDGTGRVLVDPDGATTVLKREYGETLEYGDEPTGALATFLARSDVDHVTKTIDLGITEIQLGDKHRFRERRIHDGETVYVAGVADRGVGDYDVGFGGPNAVVRRDGTHGRLRSYLAYPYVLSDYDEAVAKRKLLVRSGKILAIGGVVTLLSGYGLASVLALAIPNDGRVSLTPSPTESRSRTPRGRPRRGP